MNTLSSNIKAYVEPVVQLGMPSYKANQLSAKIIGFKEEGDNIFTVKLRPRRRSKFIFKPGQHLNILVEINGKTLKRTFSISSPLIALKKDGIIELSIKRQPNGLVTNWLPLNLKIGKKLYLEQPQGDFTYRDDPAGKASLMLAAGSGITPIISMLESCSSTDLKDLFLIYHVNDSCDTPFDNRLQTLAKKGLSIAVVDSIKDGFICQEQLERVVAGRELGNVYCCGPSGYMSKAKKIVESLNNPNTSSPAFHCEYFGSISVEGQTDTSQRIEWIQRSGKTLVSTKNKGTLLETAEAAGLKPLHGCRSGICHQCTAQKTSGRVRNVLTNEVSSAGEEEVQLCICVAESDASFVVRERTVQ